MKSLAMSRAMELFKEVEEKAVSHWDHGTGVKHGVNVQKVKKSWRWSTTLTVFFVDMLHLIQLLLLFFCVSWLACPQGQLRNPGWECGCDTWIYVKHIYIYIYKSTNIIQTISNIWKNHHENQPKHHQMSDIIIWNMIKGGFVLHRQVAGWKRPCQGKVRCLSGGSFGTQGRTNLFGYYTNVMFKFLDVISILFHIIVIYIYVCIHSFTIDIYGNVISRNMKKWCLPYILLSPLCLDRTLSEGCPSMRNLRWDLKFCRGLPKIPVENVKWLASTFVKFFEYISMDLRQMIFLVF